MQLSCFLVTAWEAFAQFEEKTIWQQPVEFSDVSVYMPVQAERTAKVILGVLFDFSNRFQVMAFSLQHAVLVMHLAVAYALAC